MSKNIKKMARKTLMNKYKELEVSLDELLGNATELSPITYQYYKGLKNRRIIINDQISADILEYAVIPLIDMDNDGTNEPIEIILNTVGGEVYSGFCLVDVLEKLKCKTIIKIMGMAASMGILIAMVKNPNVKVICSHFSVGLIHSGSQYMEGSTHSVRDTFKFSERYEELIKEYILSHTTIDEKMYTEIERQEFWMTADDMKKYGIVDEII
jgi:ATP-dependent Clp protease protease subunit